MPLGCSGFLSLGPILFYSRRFAAFRRFDSQHIALLKCRGINGKAATVRAMLAAQAQQACAVLSVRALCRAWVFPTLLDSGHPSGLVSALYAAATSASSAASQSQPQSQSRAGVGTVRVPCATGVAQPREVAGSLPDTRHGQVPIRYCFSVRHPAPDTARCQ